jgi:hypothetical protein
VERNLKSRVLRRSGCLALDTSEHLIERRLERAGAAANLCEEESTLERGERCQGERGGVSVGSQLATVSAK